MSASWRSWIAGSEQSEPRQQSQNQDKGEERNGRGDFDIVLIQKGPRIVFDKPVKGKGAAAAGAGAGKGGAAGTGEGQGDDEEGEEDVGKTLLQK